MDVYPYSPEMQHFVATAIVLAGVLVLMFFCRPAGNGKKVAPPPQSRDVFRECMDAFRDIVDELCGKPLPKPPARLAVYASRFAEAAAARADRARLRCAEWTSSIAACAVLAGVVSAMPDGGDGTALLEAGNEALQDAEQALDACIPCPARAIVDALQDEFVQRLAGRGCTTAGDRQAICEGIRAAFLAGAALTGMAPAEVAEDGERQTDG